MRSGRLQTARNPDAYRLIWGAVMRIPRGKVATYGQVAALCRRPRHARLVGYALHNLPHSSGVPWHRVINSKGRISFPARSLSYMEQKALLEREGILLKNGVVDLQLFGWHRKVRRKRRAQ